VGAVGPEALGTINWGVEDRSRWRSSKILCDATVEMLKSEPEDLTGRRLVDKDFFRRRGWTQEKIDSYWPGGTLPQDLARIDGPWTTLGRPPEDPLPLDTSRAPTHT
jgi:hypothetical protein